MHTLPSVTNKIERRNTGTTVSEGLNVIAKKHAALLCFTSIHQKFRDIGKMAASRFARYLLSAG